MPLSKNYLFEWGHSWGQKAPIRFVDIMRNANVPSEEHKEIVFVHSVLTDRENAGYDLSHAIVTEVNGVKVDSFNTLVNTIEKSKSKDIKISLQGGSIIILNKDKAQAANERLLHRYGIKDSSYLK